MHPFRHVTWNRAGGLWEVPLLYTCLYVSPLLQCFLLLLVSRLPVRGENLCKLNYKLCKNQLLDAFSMLYTFLRHQSQPFMMDHIRISGIIGAGIYFYYSRKDLLLRYDFQSSCLKMQQGQQQRQLSDIPNVAKGILVSSLTIPVLDVLQGHKCCTSTGRCDAILKYMASRHGQCAAFFSHPGPHVARFSSSLWNPTVIWQRVGLQQDQFCLPRSLERQQSKKAHPSVEDWNQRSPIFWHKTTYTWPWFGFIWSAQKASNLLAQPPVLRVKWTGHFWHLISWLSPLSKLWGDVAMAMSPFGLLGHELQTNLQDSLPALAAAWKFQTNQCFQTPISHVYWYHMRSNQQACNLCQSCQSLDSRRLLGMLPTSRFRCWKWQFCFHVSPCCVMM